MSLLDSVEDDPSPIVATIDFNSYYAGAKLSTKAREYFEAKKEAYGITGSSDQELFDYFAHILFDRMKEEMLKELAAQAEASKKQAVTQVETFIQSTASEITSLQLIKK